MNDHGGCDCVHQGRILCALRQVYCAPLKERFTLRRTSTFADVHHTGPHGEHLALRYAPQQGTPAAAARGRAAACQVGTFDVRCQCGRLRGQRERPLDTAVAVQAQMSPRPRQAVAIRLCYAETRT